MQGLVTLIDVLEAIVGVAIATAFLGAIALFTTNLGDSRARLARTSREIDCAEAVFTAIEMVRLLEAISR